MQTITTISSAKPLNGSWRNGIGILRRFPNGILRTQTSKLIIDAYLAYLTDEPGAEALSEEDEETALDAQRTEWRLHKDDMEIVWSYDPNDVVRVSDNFPAEVMAFLKEHAPAFNGER